MRAKDARSFSVPVSGSKKQIALHNSGTLKSNAMFPFFDYSVALNQIAWDQGVFRIDGEGPGEHTHDPAAAAPQRSFLNDLEFFDFLLLRIGAQLDLKRMDISVLLNEYIDLLRLVIPIKAQKRVVSCVGVVLDKLHDHIVFIDVSARSTLTERIRRQPTGQIGTQSGIAKIQLGRFDKTLQFIVGVSPA